MTNISYAISDDVVMREDDFVIYSRRTGAVLSTNLSGFAFSLIFSNCMPYPSACNLLADAIDEDRYLVHTVFESFFAELIAGGFIVETESRTVT